MNPPQIVNVQFPLHVHFGNDRRSLKADDSLSPTHLFARYEQQKKSQQPSGQTRLGKASSRCEQENRCREVGKGGQQFEDSILATEDFQRPWHRQIGPNSEQGSQ